MVILNYLKDLLEEYKTRQFPNKSETPPDKEDIEILKAHYKTITGKEDDLLKKYAYRSFLETQAAELRNSIN